MNFFKENYTCYVELFMNHDPTVQYEGYAVNAALSMQVSPEQQRQRRRPAAEPEQLVLEAEVFGQQQQQGGGLGGTLRQPNRGQVRTPLARCLFTFISCLFTS